MKVFRFVRQFAREIQSLSLRLSKLDRKLDQMKELAAKDIINRIREHGIYEDIHQAEFKVYSQFGDDGIIQYLINNVDIEERTFVEFGVENYTEASTRFLLINDNWRGLVIDGSQSNIQSIKSDEIYWKHDLTAVDRFIDKTNINEIIAANNFSGPLGILSIDIDGNDYWVWESINVVDPVIVIMEYNSVFGKERAVTVPYDSAFRRAEAHHSNLYWGCSLKALCLLAEKKGYAFVGCNSNGNNAYFVRKDKVNGIRQHTVESGYVLSMFRESRNADGTLTYLSGDERKKAIGKMTVYDVEKEMLVKIEDL